MADHETIQTIVNLSGLRQRLYLVSKGVPYDIAMVMPENECWAYWIILGEIDGSARWDFQAWCWRAVEK